MTHEIGLLIDETSLQEWQHRAVKTVLNDTRFSATISTVILNKNQTSTDWSSRLTTFLRNPSVWNCVIAYRILKRKFRGPPWYRRQVPLGQVIDLSNVNIHRCTPLQADGLGSVLPEDAVTALSEVDTGIRFGFGIVKGEALQAPDNGILSYHHGDISEYRGRPAGFHEFIHGETKAGVTVQRLSEELDAGTVVSATHCNIADARSLSDVKERLFFASARLLSEAIYRLIEDELPEQPASTGAVYSTPEVWKVLQYYRQRVRKSL